MSVWSVEGQGSTFTLTLPLNPHHHDGPSGPVAMVVPPRRTPDPTPRARHHDADSGANTEQQEVRR
ncbi:hypothetical protein [Nocardioides sp. B-3]|uniref:hypothetical protein n=1 Tax=Nocardioides sp. B-3 TaxID=2895565 RepID=UPI0021535E2D|nr:hypothetical protein [Nocardioides sp. B-3]UUZ61889.1 hypothetical protein LP418_14725 [Nocardioides sp. B-3]